MIKTYQHIIFKTRDTLASNHQAIPERKQMEQINDHVMLWNNR